MDYRMFKEVLKEAVQELLPDTTIEYREVLKNNGIRLDGLTVRFPEESIAPTVYVNDYYNDADSDEIDGKDIQGMAEHIVWLINSNKIEKGFDPESLIQYDNIKDRICFKLVNYERNEDFLKTLPHKKFLDLAIVYFIAISDEEFESASILINNAHLELWGKTAEELDEIAKENTPKIFKPELKSMFDTLTEIILRKSETPEDEPLLKEALTDCGMFVLSNEKKQFGAGVILYENILKNFADKLQTNVYVIPSSTHETILLPSYLVDDESKLNDMILEVNATQVPLQDILSNHFYYYNKDDDEIINPEKEGETFRIRHNLITAAENLKGTAV